MSLPAASCVLTIRIAGSLERSLEREARRRRKTKSELARELLLAGLAGGAAGNDLAQEARRQSMLASRGQSERVTIAFVEKVADTRGWR